MNGFQEAENPRSVFFFYEYFVYLARQPALKTLLDVFPFDLYFDFFSVPVHECHPETV